jgi:hypothetical protein
VFPVKARSLGLIETPRGSLNFFQLILRFTMALVRGGIEHVSHHVTEVNRVYRGHTGNYGHLNFDPKSRLNLI